MGKVLEKIHHISDGFLFSITKRYFLVIKEKSKVKLENDTNSLRNTSQKTGKQLFKNGKILNLLMNKE